ncbi:transposase [Nocardia sp. SYP-A9097]|uniref:zinc ribbon domain-containing protein n=1 Tax=Nocardia sp. SYP-A9097 TaxID=2663237 RepID=UPI00132A2747|nr:hypothetical protein [Nocardia sp. SYP-A9097]MRH88428.1 transposase [Nocardia sp. SYP-A9097]
MSSKPVLAEGETTRTATARVPIRLGVDDTTGEIIDRAVLTDRIGWCVDLVSDMAIRLVVEHWNADDLGLLGSGQDSAGDKLPSNAWMALRRLGWTVNPAVKVNDRIVRMAQEQAGRTLRSACWRAALTSAILSSWPDDPHHRTGAEWDAVRAAAPGGKYLPSNVVKGRTRQIARFAAGHGRRPVDVFELEPAPRTARMLLLSAVDQQQASIERSAIEPDKAGLRLQLPLRPDPRTYKDWAWVALPIILPATVPAHAILHLPTLRLVNGTVRADLSFTQTVPIAHRSGHTVALGVDWGLNTLLSAGAVRLDDKGVITALGAGGQYRAAGILAKQHRLRRLGETLHTKHDHYTRLIAGRADHPLAVKQATLAAEIGHVANRRSNLNGALAASAARWTVDQAIATSATVIYLEDLRSLEATGMGRTLNTLLSQQVRGAIGNHIRHLAAEVGIAVVTVPARGTSKHCPLCLTPLRHSKAPDRPTVAGWKWALCPNPDCRWQGDRDQGAWRRIAARGLAHQSKTVTDRATGAMTIRAIDAAMEATAILTTPTTAVDRSKTGPTVSRSSCPAPRRRGAPSPARPHGRTGQRPEGHAPTGRTLPRAAHRNQDVSTISTPTDRHTPRGAALGAGFHLHTHATPPRWEPIPPIPHPRDHTGSLN